MYRIKNIDAFKNISIMGKFIPNELTEVKSLVKFFNKEVYNNIEMTDKKLYDYIKSTEKGSLIMLEEVIEELPEVIKPIVNKIDYGKLTNKELFEIARNKKIKVSKTATKKELIRKIKG